MADTTAMVSLEKVVSTYLADYKLPTEDWVSYMGHACKVVQDFNLYDGNIVTTQKVTIDTTLKCIELPDDFLRLVDLVTPLRGQWWSFTEKDRIVNTTTTTDSVEGRDLTQGEGQTIDQTRVTSYGAKGGWNKFRYTLDTKARRIYVDDDITDYVVLIYVSSGINATEETLVPTTLMPMIDAYLNWKGSYWRPEIMNQRESLYLDYWREKQKVRNLIASMTEMQWRDLLYSTFTQSPQR